MKKNLLLLVIAVIMTFAIQIHAQAPQSFKYQAVARNSSGNIIANQKVSFSISILQGSTSGTSVYSETDTVTTNQFGLANLNIGSGTVVFGSMSAINWGNNTYFVKIEFDPTGGTTYQFMGTSQLLSVPYALYSEKSGQSNIAGNGITINGDTIKNSMPNQPVTLTGTGAVAITGTYPNFNVGASDTTIWKKNGANIYYNAGNVGVGTTSNISNLNVVGNQSIYMNNGSQTSILVQNASIPPRATRLMLMNDSAAGTTSKWSMVKDYDQNGGDNLVMEYISTSSIATTPFVLNGNSGNVGIGTFSPTQKLHVEGNIMTQNGDVYISNSTNGAILTSPNGGCWRITINNSGTLVTTSITCP